jgi:hypothetical protein
MNIFVLDNDLEKSCQYHNDKHVVKMILEGIQILSTALWETGKSAPYKSTHKNHPCCIWAKKSLSNWRWLKSFVLALNNEKIFRYGKSHRSVEFLKEMEEPDIPDIGLTPFVQAMPEIYRGKDAVKAYRKYYICEKKHFSTWKNRPTPYWMK